VMAPPQLSVSLALTEAVSAKLDSLFGRSCLISRSLIKVTKRVERAFQQYRGQFGSSMIPPTYGLPKIILFWRETQNRLTFSFNSIIAMATMVSS
jgi:hypothetical protein